MQFFSYWFWPNPAGWNYADLRVQGVLALCLALVLLSFGVRFWRQGLKNPMTKQLSKSWSSVLFWFGLVGIVLVITRVEMIQFLAMRAMWALWVLCLALTIAYQFLQFRRRHYTVLRRTQVVDERDKYLPRSK